MAVFWVITPSILVEVSDVPSAPVISSLQSLNLLYSRSLSKNIHIKIQFNSFIIIVLVLYGFRTLSLS